MLLRYICIFFFKLLGFKIDKNLPSEVDRCVMIAVPHTSNWDFVHCMAAFHLLKIPIRFTIKKSWMKPPFGWLIKPMGGLAIDRTPKKEGEKRKSVTEAMVQLFDDNPGQLAMVVTPEGTRSKRTEWKSGFYYTAKGAGVPICCGYVDYKKKIAGVYGVVYPSDDKAADLRKIMDLYKNAEPKIAENFSLDLRYV